MNVNCTLFVQIINFVIAVIAMKRLLWRPIVKLLDQEASLRRVLENNISVKRSELLQKNDALRRHWYEAKKSFARSTPRIEQQQCTVTFSRTTSQEEAVPVATIDELVSVVVTQVRRG